MRQRHHFLFALVVAFTLPAASAFSSTTVPANDPRIQYYGRWDFSDSTAPAHSWPGVYIVAKFQGTSVGIKMNDNYCYYNVTIDDTSFVFHGTLSGLTTYTLMTGLVDTTHTIRIGKRNETTWTKFTFNGFVLDDGKTLVTPDARPTRLIEFIGDSFTSASGNEWTETTACTDAAKYTNIDEGFGPIIARHFSAQYHMSSESGFGVLQDWQGIAANNIPDVFDRTHVYTSSPQWSFSQWIPNLVVICLGLNDYSGWNGYTTSVSESNKELFETRYHDFIAWIRSIYPGVKVVAVAAHPDWIQSTVQEVVTQETALGHDDVSYAWFPYYTDGYVNSGHPNVATHHLIADTIISMIDTTNLWQKGTDTTAPAFVGLPSTFTSNDTTYSLTVRTSEYATVKYGLVDGTYSALDSTAATSTRLAHTLILSGHHGESRTYYLKATDNAGNTMASAATLTFTVDTSRGMIAWYSPSFDDSQWATGDAPLGVGADLGNTTVLNQITTAYFRKKVTVSDVNATNGLIMTLIGNDGAIVYVNGSEVFRMNMPSGSGVGYDTYATKTLRLLTDTSMTSSNKKLAKWKDGENLVAVEVHAANGGRHLSFDTMIDDCLDNEYLSQCETWSYYAAGTAPSAQAVTKTSAVASSSASVPDHIALEQNYPNPFNPSTTIRYELGGGGSRYSVSLNVYNLLGQHVASLAEGDQTSGVHIVRWDAGQFATGVYFVRLTVHAANGQAYSHTMKTMLVK